MSIGRHAGNLRHPSVHNAESMYGTIQEWGLIPFFENVIPGYSIEELTPARYWFDGEEDGLGPWDWKIECVRSGEIAYGKFLLGGKAAFATLPWYRELRNYRLSLPKYQPDAVQQQILDYVDAHGAITVREVRRLLGVKKSAADAQITRLQMQCRLVTGELQRVYRGKDLHYSGWQIASFCRPEDLFEAPAFPGLAGFPGAAAGHPLEPDCSPAESFERLCAHITARTGETDRARLRKLLG